MRVRPGVSALVGECTRPGLPGIVPSERYSLAAVPGLLLDELAAARRGVVVLAVDGLSHGAAATAWRSAELGYLTSTFPSTSAPAWLTASTGTGPSGHGVPGMVYRVGDELVYAVTGARIGGTGGSVTGGTRGADGVGVPGVVLARPTVFERATAAGARCVAVGRELDHLPGPWAPALLRGARRVSGPGSADLTAQAADPALLVENVIAQVTAVLAEPPATTPVLLWIYVNLDDHVHANGYDGAALTAMRRLDEAATAWAVTGWTVVGHSDHGQVPVRPDPALAEAWRRVDDPADCVLPGGGAGRVRWLHPRPGREDAVHARLAGALGDAAVVVRAGELALPPGLELPADRVGSVVAIAASERFPVPDPALRYEHGGMAVDEMVIPFAVWRPPRG